MKSSGELIEDFRKIVFLNEAKKKAEPGDPGYRTADEYNEAEGLEPGDPGYADNDEDANRDLTEKWDSDYETPKSKRGMFKGRTQASLKAELEGLKNKENKTEADKTKEHQLVFALRAKHDFGSIKESDAEYLKAALSEGVRIGFEELLKNNHEGVDAFIETNQLPQHLFNVLYDYYFDEMPYGIAKARSGDPEQWIADRFRKDLEHEGLCGEKNMMGMDDQMVPATDVLSVSESKKDTGYKPGPFSKKGHQSK